METIKGASEEAWGSVRQGFEAAFQSLKKAKEKIEQEK